MIGKLETRTAEIDVPDQNGELMKSQVDLLAMNVHTMRIKETLRLIPQDRRAGNGAEVFDVQSATGGWPVVGIAYQSVIERGDNVGKDRFKIMFDEPELVAAFPHGLVGWPLSDGWRVERDRPQRAD